MTSPVEEVLLKDFHPKSLLRVGEHIPRKPRFPVIDAHNHLFGDSPAEKLIEVMDAAGVQVWVNVTGNVTLPLVNKTYTIARREFNRFATDYMEKYPGRFAALTMSDFAQWSDPVLLKDDFVDRCIQNLEEDLAQGACGLKVTKELGLFYRDAGGAMLRVDDRRLYPIWRRAGELGVPVLIHVSDPAAFFLPIDARNEHYLTLREFPAWSFFGSRFSKEELLQQRNRMIADHPKTRFLLPHVANQPEDLGSVSQLLDTCANVAIDVTVHRGLSRFSRRRRHAVRKRPESPRKWDCPPRPEGDRHIFRPSSVLETHAATGRKMSQSPAARQRLPFAKLPGAELESWVPTVTEGARMGLWKAVRSKYSDEQQIMATT